MNAAGRMDIAKMLCCNGFKVESRPFANWDNEYASALLAEQLAELIEGRE